MAKIVLPDVGAITEAIRTGVERRLGKRRTLYTAEDLIEDVGLSQDDFEALIAELEQEYDVAIDPETLDQLTTAGALVVRLIRMLSQPAPEEEDGDRAAA